MKLKKIIIYLIIIIFLVGCENGYRKQNGKIYFVSYGGPLPMFGLNWERHQLELKDVDSKTFVDFKYRHIAKDKNHIYKNGVICGTYDFDAPTFEVEGDYGKDKNHIYYLRDMKISILDSADLKTFVGLGYDRGKDAFNIFKGKSIDKFRPHDILSYEMMPEINDWRFGRDKYYYYYCDKTLDVDRSTFQFLPNYYAKDKNRVYYYYLSGTLSVIEGADTKTFKVLTRKKLAKGVAKDKNTYYIGMEKVTKKEANKAP